MIGRKKKAKIQLFKHQAMVTALFVLGMILITTGGSMAFFASTSTADEYNSIKAGNLELSYVDKGDGLGDILSLNGSYPVSDTEGMSKDPYRFNITNTGNIMADFKIKIANDEAIIGVDCCQGISIDSTDCQKKLLQPEYIKYQFDNEEPVLLSTKQASDYTIYETKNLIPGNSEIHELKIWITENAPNTVLGKHYHGKVVIEAIQSGVNDNFASAILLDNTVVNVDTKNHPELNPNLTQTSDEANEEGLYMYKYPNSNMATYYFRGAVTNNWVRFADQDWRIVRINEDGSIRLVLQNSLQEEDENSYQYSNRSADVITNRYYTNWPTDSLTVRAALIEWYNTNIDKDIPEISGKKYSDYLVDLPTGSQGDVGYFCEREVVASNVPDFGCVKEGNETDGYYGKVNQSIALLTYAEAVFAGGSRNSASNYYLKNGTDFITMSPAGYEESNFYAWKINNNGKLEKLANNSSFNIDNIRPVINLKGNVIITGKGTQTDKYVVQYTED